MNRPRLALAAVVAIGALAACGGGDDDADAPGSDGGPTPVVPADSLPTGPVPGGPNATVPADLPDDYRLGVGPIEVIGQPLPGLAGAPIDADPAVGLAAPVLVGVGVDGKPVRIDAATDGATMVVFLAHWCPHCNAEVPRLTELRDAGRFPADLDIVAVATASDPQRPNFPPGEWLFDKDWTWPALIDGVDANGPWAAASSFGVDGFPFIAVLDADGKVAARWSGESEPDEIIARLEAALS